MNLTHCRLSFRWLLFFGASFLFLLSGCSTMQPHLASNEIDALRSIPITIIYVQPDKELDAYLATPSTVGAAGIGFGFIGGFVGGLTDSVIDKEHYETFAAKLDPFHGLIHKLQISDEVYTSTHNTLSTVSWLKDANWQTVSQSNDSSFFHEQTRLANTQVVMFISPRVGLRSDASALNVSYNVNIYTKNPNDKYDIHRFDGGIVTYERQIQFTDSLNNGSAVKTDKESVDQKLNKVFADNGALLASTLMSALPEATARLKYYITGEKMQGTIAGQSQ